MGVQLTAAVTSDGKQSDFRCLTEFCLIQSFDDFIDASGMAFDQAFDRLIGPKLLGKLVLNRLEKGFVFAKRCHYLSSIHC